MPELFIPQPQDNVTPAMNLYKLMQDRKQYELDLSKQGTLQDYHTQLAVQGKLNSIISMAKDQPEAAAQLYNSDPDLMKINGGVQIKFKEAQGDWNIFESSSGEAYKINKKDGKMVKADVNFKKPEDSLEKILAGKVASGEMTIEQAYEYKKKGEPEGVNINLGSEKISKVPPSDYTPESIATFEKTGDYSDLVSVKKEKATQARAKVTNALTTLRDTYDELDKMGAIVSTDRDAFTNTWARIKSSKYGQAVGGAVGAQEQSLRNEINQIRPLLINDMRQASEMGARGLDSEKELEFYLNAATDPARDIQANRSAINVLNAAYGLGDKVLSKEGRQQKEAELNQAKNVAAGLGLTYDKNLPKGIPQGSKQIGTKDGNPVYETPDGKRMMAE